MAILIFICFSFLLYGFYSKISNTQDLSSLKINNYSLSLKDSEKIKDIKIIDENNILAVIYDGDQTSLIIYNFKLNKIISKIGK